MPPSMKTEDFKGSVSSMKKSPWLSSEDLLGLRDGVNVDVESVHRHQNAVFDEGRIEAEVFSLKFKGKDKELVLNATNRKTMAKAYTSLTSNWIGKTVNIHVVDGVRKPGGKKGETTTGLRIRPVSDPIVDRGKADQAFALGE